MAMRFIRKVRTASGAVAVQIVNRTGRTVTGIEHIGSAHTDAELGVLLAKAERELRPGQQAFDLGDEEQLPVRTSDVAARRILDGHTPERHRRRQSHRFTSNHPLGSS